MGVAVKAGAVVVGAVNETGGVAVSAVLLSVLGLSAVLGKVLREEPPAACRASSKAFLKLSISGGPLSLNATVLAMYSFFSAS